MLRLKPSMEKELSDLRESVRRLVGEYQKQASIYYEAFVNDGDQWDDKASDIYGKIASDLTAFLAENKELTPPQTEGRES